MRTFIKVMKALSDPNRVKILKMLQKKTLCVCEIQASLGVAQPTASNHLKLLEDAGLVIAQKKGPWVDYSLSDGRGNPYAATLLGNLKHWLQDEPEVLRITENLAGIRREDICRKEPRLPLQAVSTVVDTEDRT
jgi:ArsR family transcriptional regulator, arsenate/arsenite/antimonite-responsive transcriptional repressor